MESEPQNADLANYKLNLKLLSICMQHVLSFEFQKFRIFKILNFHPCYWMVERFNKCFFLKSR